MKASSINEIDIINVIDGIPHGVAILDNDLRILEVNRAMEALTGYASEDVKYSDGNSVIRSNIAEELGSAFENGNERLVVEGNIINAYRKIVPMRFTVSRLMNGKGAKGSILLVMEDISLIKDMGLKLHGDQRPKGILGNSPKLQEVIELLPVFANTNATLLITGETGTGKDLLAEAIHNLSGRGNHPFIKINCGALPEALLESELFGHVRGAFTGAHSDKPGMFRLANGGTLFLTEIGDLPLPLQVKLLTVLDDKEFYPLGSSNKVRVDVRIITGTHRDLKQLLHDGRFREDLYYRLNVLRAHMSPLRQRGDDVLLLANHFIKDISRNIGRNIKGLSRETTAFLKTYKYPGNVRELRNIIEHAVNMCQENTIRKEHMPAYILSSSDNTDEGSSVRAEHPSSDPIAEKGSSWSDIEKKSIVEAMLSTGGNRTEASNKLGWGRSTLWRKMKKHGLA